MAFDNENGFGASRLGMARNAARSRATQSGQRSFGNAAKPAEKPLQAIGGRWSEEELIGMIPELMSSRHADAIGIDAYAGIGSRETPQDVLDEMTAIATVLEGAGYRMRSGGAGGADTAFDHGVVDRANKDVILPWRGFSGIEDGVMLPRHLEAQAEKLALKYHPAPDKLYEANGRPKAALKLHTRNMPQVLGLDLETPAKMVLAYTPDGAASGGTGQAIRVAEDFGVPVLNLRRPAVRAAVLDALDLTPDRVKTLAAEARARKGISDPAVKTEAKAFDFSKAREQRSWDRSKSAVFFKGSDEYGPFTNMSPRFPYKDGELSWKSSEHQYQAGRFPHRPDLQEAIFSASDAFTAKMIARENAKETRKDWEQVNVPLMAYVVTRRRDAHPTIQALLDKANSRGLTIVEQSSRDRFWGAVEENGKLTGRNVLGGVLDQAADGARLDVLPRGTSFPTAAEMAALREVRLEAESRDEKAPAVHRDVASQAAPAAQPGKVSYAKGNVAVAQAQVIVNTVNANLSKASRDGRYQDGRGVMGKGVAKAFHDVFGEAIMKPYEAAIRSGELKAGKTLLFDLPNGQVMAAMATKQDWRDDSKIEWVEDALKDLATRMKAAGLTSVAIPPPGCGNGGLNWSKVEPLVKEHLKDFDLTIYGEPSWPPQGVEMRRDVIEGKKAAARDAAQPAMKSSMYFSYGRSKRPGVESSSTFEAILSGERTSTTRFDNWNGSERWGRLEEGQIVRMFEDKEMKGRYVDVRVTGVERIDLANASADRLEEWSKAEGWSVEAGRAYGQKNQPGWQVRYEPVPGQEILKERVKDRKGDDLPLLAAAQAMRTSRGR